MWTQTAVSQPPPQSQLRGQAPTAKGEGRAPQIGLWLLQAGSCIKETWPLPPAQAASLLLLLPWMPGTESTNQTCSARLARQAAPPASREKRRNTQSLRLEEEEPKPNLRQVTFAENRGSSSDGSVCAPHIVLPLININNDLQFSGVIAFEDGG